MNASTLSELERAYKEANAWYNDLYAMQDVFMRNPAERKDYRKALARAKFDRETALIELDAVFVPPVQWFAKAA